MLIKILLGISLIFFKPTFAEVSLRDFLEKVKSQSTDIKECQYVSLSIAYALLDYTEKELLKAGIYKQLDMTNEEPTYWGAVKEVLFNTTHAGLMLLTDYEKHLLTIWETQITQIQRTKIIIRYLQTLLKEKKDLSSALEPQNLLRLAPDAYGELDSLLNSPFIKDISSKGFYEGSSLLESLPTLESLGLHFSVNFLSYDWKTITMGQCNAFNVWMFILLPRHLEAFGKTKYGTWTVKTFRLQKIIDVLRKVPRPFDSVAVMFAIETADGCTIRWIYTGLVAHDKLTQDAQENKEKYIEEALKKK